MLGITPVPGQAPESTRVVADRKSRVDLTLSPRL